MGLTHKLAALHIHCEQHWSKFPSAPSHAEAKLSTPPPVLSFLAALYCFLSGLKHLKWPDLPWKIYPS